MESNNPLSYSLSVDPRMALIDAARQFYQQGWMVGTAGNLSARLPDGSCWITASGRSKGTLTVHDFLRISPQGTVLEPLDTGLKPSAETCIHQAIYHLFPAATACFHVHSVEANVVSRLVQGDALLLPPLEMLKGLEIWHENPHCHLSIFTNHAQVDAIAADIRERFQTTAPAVPAFLIRDHGVTVWASSLESARNRIELVEYIFRYMVLAHGTAL